MVSTDPIPLETLRRLPKVELHVHLDTSVRPSTVGDLGRRQGIAIPDDLDSALIAPPICNNLADYLTRVDLALQVLQTAEALERVAYELVEDMAAERMVYAEIRYAPQLCIRGGLSMQQVIDAVASGLRLQGRLRRAHRPIICCLRHDPIDLSQRYPYAIANWAGQGHWSGSGADRSQVRRFPSPAAFAWRGASACAHGARR